MALHERLTNRWLSFAWASSRLSRPAIAEASVALPARLSVLTVMTPHLLAQPVGDLAGQLGHRDRVDPPGPGPRHLVLLDHGARTAAEHHDAVTEPHGLAHVVRDE